MLKFKEILSALKQHNIQFVFVGGQAAVARGSAYVTLDVDLCYARDEENLENIVNALSPFHPYLRGADKNLPFIFDARTLKMGLNFTFCTDIGDIDLLGEISGIGTYEDVLKFSETMEIYGMDCKVLTIDGLIKSKEAAGRQKDEAVIKELRALQEIQRQKKKEH